MNGPTNKESRISLWPGWLEASSVFFGLIVFVGLAVESGPEIWALIVHGIPLPRSLVGQVLVTVGVFGEVAAGFFIARSAKKQEVESNTRIAELNAETERLRKENNETALLLAYRSVGDLLEFKNAMRKFFGTKYVMEVLTLSSEGYSPNEVATFRWELALALNEAGWSEISPPRRRYSLGYGVAVFTAAKEDTSVPLSEAGEALTDWLVARKVATVPGITIRDDLTPGTLVIEIGPKPETPEQQRDLMSVYAKRRESSRPVTPPQT